MLDINKVYNMDFKDGMKDIDEESIDLVVTDPPYNTGMTKRNNNGWLNNFFNDSYTKETYDNLITSFVTSSFRVLKNNTAMYIFVGWKVLGQWLDAIDNAGFKVKNVIVWDKVVHGLNYHNYAYTYELLIYAVKGKVIVNNKSHNDLINKYYTDVWHIQRDMHSEVESEHETIKSMSVVELPILHASQEGDLILDPFMGSGTTAVAAIETKRNFIGFEIVKEYCDIANRRIEEAMRQVKQEDNYRSWL